MHIYLSDKPNLILIGHKRAEIQSLEVNETYEENIDIASL